MLTLRPLRPWDALFCWRLANEPSVRVASHDPTPPTWWGHVRWMLAWLFSGGRKAWVVEAHPTFRPGTRTVPGHEDTMWSGAIGLVRVQRGENEEVRLVHVYTDQRPRPREATVGIALLSRYRGRGYASDAITVAARWAIGHGWGIPTARIRADNHASIGAFAKAGFEMTGAREGWVTMQLLPPDRPAPPPRPSPWQDPGQIWPAA